MVEEMHQAGMDFQPHSYRHLDLRGTDSDFLIFEILAPKEAIEARTGEASRFYAYPSGRYDDRTISFLKSANYWGAVITEQGAIHTSDGLFELDRVRIRGTHNLDDFENLMAFDW
jgi:peptidoglycan/xylan/chitin deacetylase (PgdA/CDA1 family)